MATIFKKLKIYIYIKLIISFCYVNNLHAKPINNCNSRTASLVIDRSTGKILHQENASKHLYPASLTKLMTAYLTFEALKAQKLYLNQDLIVSERAASQPKTNLNLTKGEKIKVKDALLATIIRSANDASVVLAEAISGSEEEFAKLMTKRAHQLGMHHTLFRNASGLPNPAQKTTAYDMAKLAIALDRDFPDYYNYFSKTNFSFKGAVYHGHNRVTKNYPGATGLKTGFINASGYNLVTSARRDDVKLVGVVFGGDTASARDKKMTNLLDKFFNRNQVVSEFILAESTKINKKNSVTNISKYKTNTSKNRTRKIKYKLVSNTKKI